MLKIERVQMQWIRLQLREPFRISSGVTSDRRILLVRLDCGGVQGVAECVAGEAPNYSYETVDTAAQMIEHFLAPAVVGREIAAARDLFDVLDHAVRGHRMAKAALEMAAWDAEARARAMSLQALLGGTRASVPAGVSIGIQPDVEALLERVEGFLEAGYRRIKLKIARGRDTAVLDAVRSRFPDIPLTVDANAAYGAEDMERLAGLDRYGLILVEQPFPEDEMLLHARLQERMETPVCLDETVTSTARCREALELSACRIINIKPGRVGGHAQSLAIHDLSEAADVPVWCGGMLESGIGRAHNVALASLPNMRLPNDTSASARYWVRDVVVPPFELGPDGMVEVPTDPGLGVEIDEDFIRSIEIDSREIY